MSLGGSSLDPALLRLILSMREERNQRMQSQGMQELFEEGAALIDTDGNQRKRLQLEASLCSLQATNTDLELSLKLAVNELKSSREEVQMLLAENERLRERLRERNAADARSSSKNMRLSNYVQETGIAWGKKRFREWCGFCHRDSASWVCLVCSPLEERSSSPRCFCNAKCKEEHLRRFH